jgi:hypothetical protein
MQCSGWREPRIGDTYSATVPEEYINPYPIRTDKGTRVAKPVGYSIRVVHVTNSFVFYDSLSIWETGYTEPGIMRRVAKSDFKMDCRTGQMELTSSADHASA